MRGLGDQCCAHLYAFDCEKPQYLWCSLGYNGLKIHPSQTFPERALEWKETRPGRAYRELGSYIASDMVEIKGN